MLSTIFTIAAVHLIALMSPGPDCFIVMQTAVGRSIKEALCCVFGITLGVAFWAALSLLGLQWLFERFAWLQQVIMLLGGLYLGLLTSSSIAPLRKTRHLTPKCRRRAQDFAPLLSAY